MSVHQSSQALMCQLRIVTRWPMELSQEKSGTRKIKIQLELEAKSSPQMFALTYFSFTLMKILTVGN